MPFGINCGPYRGSFPVRDHSRSNLGIICGPVQGSNEAVMTAILVKHIFAFVLVSNHSFIYYKLFHRNSSAKNTHINHSGRDIVVSPNHFVETLENRSNKSCTKSAIRGQIKGRGLGGPVPLLILGEKRRND